MHTPRPKYHVTLPSWSEKQINSNTFSKIGMRRYLARRETQFNKPNFPPNRRISKNISKCHCPKIVSVLFASNHSRIKLHKFSSKITSHFEQYSDINQITLNENNKSSIHQLLMPREPASTPPSSSPAINQRLNSARSTRTANLFPFTNPTFPALSSNINTPLTTRP